MLAKDLNVGKLIESPWERGQEFRAGDAVMCPKSSGAASNGFPEKEMLDCGPTGEQGWVIPLNVLKISSRCVIL